jgi:hypothetical protein
MSRYIVSLAPSQSRTRVLLLDGKDEIMRAVLPPGPSLRHRRAASTFLEGLSLWLDTKLHVALSADASDASYCLELVDEFGCATRSVFYDVEVVEPSVHRRGHRLRGVGNFADLRQLSLVATGGGR